MDGIRELVSRKKLIKGSESKQDFLAIAWAAYRRLLARTSCREVQISPLLKSFKPTALSGDHRLFIATLCGITGQSYLAYMTSYLLSGTVRWCILFNIFQHQELLYLTCFYFSSS